MLPLHRCCSAITLNSKLTIMAKKKRQQRKKKKNRNQNAASSQNLNAADDDADASDTYAEYMTNSDNAMKAYQNLSEEEKANVTVEDLKKVCVMLTYDVYGTWFIYLI